MKITPVSVKQTLLLRKPSPCSPTAETAIQPQIWCSESLCSNVSFSRGLFLSQTPVLIYIYIYIYLSIYLSISISIYLSIYLSLYIYIYIYNSLAEKDALSVSVSSHSRKAATFCGESRASSGGLRAYHYHHYYYYYVLLVIYVHMYVCI